MRVRPARRYGRAVYNDSSARSGKSVPLNLPTDESFLTTEEVLAYLNVNLRTVYRLIKAGRIPAVRVGRQWRFRKTDIDAWLESQRPRVPRPATATTSRPAPPVGRPRV